MSHFIKKIYSKIINAHINWKVAILFSVTMPALNLINNSTQRNFSEWYRILGNWSLTFLFLFSAWIINAVLYNESLRKTNKIPFRRVLIIVIFNFVFLICFVVLAMFGLNNLEFGAEHANPNYFLLAFRGLISILVIYIIQHALYSSQKAQEVIMQNELLKMENLRARFEALRQQINPHFLFNSLSTLRSMIYSGDKNAEQFVLHLSEVYRQLLQKQEKELVLLSEELDFLNNYTFMLLSRFDNTLSITIDIDKSVLSKQIPTFCLQILVENCIKHNIISQKNPLSVKIFNSGQDALIIENNLQLKTEHQESSGLGLSNLIKRYELLGMKNAVTVFTDEIVFRVKIKLI